MTNVMHLPRLIKTERLLIAKHGSLNPNQGSSEIVQKLESIRFLSISGVCYIAQMTAWAQAGKISAQLVFWWPFKAIIIGYKTSELKGLINLANRSNFVTRTSRYIFQISIRNFFWTILVIIKAKCKKASSVPTTHELICK